MGFGHRVYKNYDPRAKILKETCKKVLKHVGVKNDPILELAIELEKIALKDQYFIISTDTGYFIEWKRKI